MPFIHIQSLPLVRSIETPQVLKGIVEDFAQATQIDLRHIHATWQYLEPEHYARGLSTPSKQPLSEHPVLVDLLTPDLHDDEHIALMLRTIANSIAERAQFPYSNIFIAHREARSGRVFDAGEVEHW
ncbi:MAG: hypothetical protein R3183_13145 [Oleiphilaceae bacterium]|nr:hypothetical protein [Oleiphilaceae bacterium]